MTDTTNDGTPGGRKLFPGDLKLLDAVAEAIDDAPNPAPAWELPEATKEMRTEHAISELQRLIESPAYSKASVTRRAGMFDAFKEAVTLLSGCNLTCLACHLISPRIAVGLHNGDVLILDVEPKASNN